MSVTDQIERFCILLSCVSMGRHAGVCLSNSGVYYRKSTLAARTNRNAARCLVTATSPDRSVLATTLSVVLFTIIDASIPSCSTESTARFMSRRISAGQSWVRLVPRICGDEASAHRLEHGLPPLDRQPVTVRVGNRPEWVGEPTATSSAC